MKIHTKYHGELEIQPEDILTFEKGIPGFSEEKEFTILPLSEDGIFQVLQSLSNNQLGFIIANPFQFFKNYDFKMEHSAVEELDLSSEKDVLVYTILTFQDPFEKTTANLQAPIVINRVKQKGKQVILNDINYKTKHSLFSNEPLASKG